VGFTAFAADEDFRCAPKRNPPTLTASSRQLAACTVSSCASALRSVSCSSSACASKRAARLRNLFVGIIDSLSPNPSISILNTPFALLVQSASRPNSAMMSALGQNPTSRHARVMTFYDQNCLQRTSGGPPPDSFGLLLDAIVDSHLNNCDAGEALAVRHYSYVRFGSKADILHGGKRRHSIDSSARGRMIS
jgi:hypothetical protein